MNQEEMLQRVIDVQARHTENLMRKKHVTGVAVGIKTKEGKSTGEMSLVVMVEKKVPPEQLAPRDVIPTEIEGVTVDVQVMGPFRAQPE